MPNTSTMFQSEIFPFSDEEIINGALPSAIRQNVSTTLNDVLNSIQNEFMTGEKPATNTPAPTAPVGGGEDLGAELPEEEAEGTPIEDSGERFAATKKKLTKKVEILQDVVDKQAVLAAIRSIREVERELEKGSKSYKTLQDVIDLMYQLVHSLKD